MACGCAAIESFRDSTSACVTAGSFGLATALAATALGAFFFFGAAWAAMFPAREPASTRATPNFITVVMESPQPPRGRLNFVVRSRFRDYLTCLMAAFTFSATLAGHGAYERSATIF